MPDIDSIAAYCPRCVPNSDVRFPPLISPKRILPMGPSLGARTRKWRRHGERRAHLRDTEDKAKKHECHDSGCDKQAAPARDTEPIVPAREVPAYDRTDAERPQRT